jgi:hypothetical protein
MSDAVDPVTRTLTGGLPFVLLLAAFLTWPIAIGLLRLYTRAVRRSMRTSAAHTTSASGAPVAEMAAPAIQADAVGRAAIFDLPLSSIAPDNGRLLGHLIARPRRAAVAYALGGVAYALIMASAQLLSDGLEFFPIRFSFLFWLHLWPVVLATGIVAASTRVHRVALVAVYFAVLFAVAALAMPASPDATWGQVWQAWAMNNLPATLVMLTYLSRRVRAVGPLVLIFMVVSLAGTYIPLYVAASDDRLLLAIVGFAGLFGLGGIGTFWAMRVLGFLTFAAMGWLALGWIRRKYQAKRISDESVTTDAIWVLFSITDSIDLVFSHPLWALTGFVAFAAYKWCVRIGLSWAGRDLEAGHKTPVLLVLRSFSIGKDGERLFDVVDRFWRRVGSIQMIAGVDLAHRTVEPHEFLDFISGKLARRFIGGAADLEQRMQERDMRPDRDHRFRVNDFFCYDDTWKMVLSRLVRDSDAVLMDLRGFSRQNAGCVFELGELARMVPLERVVFIVDRRTDEQLLAETLGERRAGVYRLHSMSGRHVRELMRSLAAAASPQATAPAQ